VVVPTGGEETCLNGTSALSCRRHRGSRSVKEVLRQISNRPSTGCGVVEGAQSVVAHIFGLADTSGRFRRLVPPLLKPISKGKIIREESWDRGVA
jgi:hypothetical protein